MKEAQARLPSSRHEARMNPDSKTRYTYEAMPRAAPCERRLKAPVPLTQQQYIRKSLLMSFISSKSILFDFAFIFPDPGSNQVSSMASDCLVSPKLEPGLLSLYIPGNT